ncbi:MAG TPA: cyclodeaminase/cyclohydrolase family protein [Thermoplasmata archaeon]|nr:cyclodeaminase/cyclohydrolase family protein [Thermoplasmata archaeon]
MRDEPLGRFLDAVASPTPTPGGGSAAALAGALSVALSRMVLGLARGKRGYEAVEARLAEIEGRAVPLQARLEALVEDDAKAYGEVVRARKLPRSSDAERAVRVRELQAAYRRATEVPLATLEACAEALELADTAAEIGSRGAATDAGVAVLLGEAAARGAAMNVRVNLPAIRDEPFRSEAEDRLEALEARTSGTAARALARIDGRL